MRKADGGELLLVTREHLDPPAMLEVERVVRGAGRHARWEYARATSTTPSGIGAGGEATVERVVLRRRSGKRWRLPRSGEVVEVQLWTDPHPTADVFEEPTSGARLFVVLRGSLEAELARWAEASRARPVPQWQYFRVFDGSAERGRPRGLGRTDPTGPRWNCELLGRGGRWTDSEYLARYHVLGTKEDDHVLISEEEARRVVAEMVAEGRIPPTEI